MLKVENQTKLEPTVRRHATQHRQPLLDCQLLGLEVREFCLRFAAPQVYAHRDWSDLRCRNTLDCADVANMSDQVFAQQSVKAFKFVEMLRVDRRAGLDPKLNLNE
jgi:hypothetical protein